MSEKKSLSEQINKAFEQNKNLKVLIPLVVVLVVVLAFLYVPMLFPGDDGQISTDVGGSGALPPGASTENTVDILPQTEREDNDDEDIVIENDPFKSEMQGVMALTGISKNSDGLYRAIVVSGDTTFIVSKGEDLGDTGWKVDNIDDNSIEFSSEEGIKVLTLEESEEIGS